MAVGLSSYEMQWRGALPSGDRRVRVYSHQREAEVDVFLCPPWRAENPKFFWWRRKMRRRNSGIPMLSSGTEGWFWCNWHPDGGILPLGVGWVYYAIDSRPANGHLLLWVVLLVTSSPADIVPGLQMLVLLVLLNRSLAPPPYKSSHRCQLMQHLSYFLVHMPF